MHTVLTMETLATVSSALSEMANKSPWRVAKEQNVSYGTAHATHALQLHPYHIQVTHELSPLDSNQRLYNCDWLLINFKPVPMRPTLLNDIFSDEEWFSLSGYVNCQNNCYWAADNPHVRVKALLHSEKICIWCALSGTKIIGPLFFTTMITGEDYLNNAKQFVALLEETDCYC